MQNPRDLWYIREIVKNQVILEVVDNNQVILEVVDEDEDNLGDKVIMWLSTGRRKFDRYRRWECFFHFSTRRLTLLPINVFSPFLHVGMVCVVTVVLFG